jgi:hypothetical protein
MYECAGGQLPKGTGAAQVCAAASEGDVRTVRLLHEFGVSVETGDQYIYIYMYIYAHTYICIYTYEL